MEPFIEEGLDDGKTGSSQNECQWACERRGRQGDQDQGQSGDSQSSRNQFQWRQAGKSDDGQPGQKGSGEITSCQNRVKTLVHPENFRGHEGKEDGEWCVDQPVNAKGYDGQYQPGALSEKVEDLHDILLESGPMCSCRAFRGLTGEPSVRKSGNQNHQNGRQDKSGSGNQDKPGGVHVKEENSGCQGAKQIASLTEDQDPSVGFLDPVCWNQRGDHRAEGRNKKGRQDRRQDHDRKNGIRGYGFQERDQGNQGICSSFEQVDTRKQRGSGKSVREIPRRKDDEKWNNGLDQADCRDQADMIVGGAKGNPCQGRLRHSFAELGKGVGR